MIPLVPYISNNALAVVLDVFPITIVFPEVPDTSTTGASVSPMVVEEVNLTIVLVVPPTATDVPLVPDVPVEPDVPLVPDVPDEPSVPEVPLVPVEPDVPLVPVEPVPPDVPDEPSVPEVPLVPV